jgi:hypothetical protein
MQQRFAKHIDTVDVPTIDPELSALGGRAGVRLSSGGTGWCRCASSAGFSLDGGIVVARLVTGLRLLIGAPASPGSPLRALSPRRHAPGEAPGTGFV